MTALASEFQLNDRVGLALLGAALLLAPLVVILALPPFYTGIWVQAEGVALAQHALAGLAGLGLAIERFRDDSPVFSIPVVGVALLVGLWSLIGAVFAPVPGLAIWGSPEIALGGLTFIDIGLLTAAAVVVRRRSRHLWAGVVLSACLATTVTMAAPLALHLGPQIGWTISDPRTISPYFFPDYRAFYGLFLVPLAFSVDGRARRPLMLLCLGLAAGALIASANKSALITGALMLPAGFIAAYWLRSHGRVRVILAGLVIGLAVFGTAAVYYVGQVGTWTPREGAGETIADTLGSRAQMTQLVLDGLAAHPGRLIAGFGQGHFGESLIRFFDPTTYRTHLDFGEGGVFWESVLRFDFHAHNGFVEGLLAGGIPGLLLMLALAVAPIAGASKERLGLATAFAGALTGVQLLWFQMPVSLPLMALALSCFADRTPVPRVALSAKLATGAIALASIALLGAGWAGLSAVQEVRQAATALDNGRPPPNPTACAPLSRNVGLRDIYLSVLLKSSFRKMVTALDQDATPPPTAAQTYQSSLCAAQARLADTGSLRLLAGTLNIVAGATFLQVPQGAPARPAIDPEVWGNGIDRLLDLAPQRGDLTIPYLNWTLSAGHETRTTQIADRLLARDPTDPVGLWFSGVVLAARPESRDLATRRLAGALDHGIANLMPIDNATIQAIGDAKRALHHK